MTKTLARFARQNAIALLALFIALGGTSAFAASLALPKNSVGTKQLKNNAVISSKIKNDAVTGADVKESSLGKVPSASNADHATNADNATHATSANTAAPSGGAGGALSGTYPNPGLGAGVVGPANFGTIPAARLNRSTDQVLGNATYGVIGFDTESYDNSHMHDNVTNNTRLVAPIAGVYEINAGLDYAGGSGYRYQDIVLNDATTLTQSWIDATTGGATEVNLATQANLAAGDYVTLRAYQNSGGTLDVLGGFLSSPHLEMHWVAPAAGTTAPVKSGLSRGMPSR